MSDTIIEQIVKKMITALETVQTANGFNVEVGSGGVYRPIRPDAYDRSGYTQANWVQLIEGDPVRNGTGYPGNPPRLGWDQTIILDLVYQPDSDATLSIGENLSKFNADVQIALFADPANPPGGYSNLASDNAFNQWGGLAVNTEDGDPELFIATEDNFVGYQKIITIQYRHKENNPYEQ
jgi:hypothetical protein